MNNEEKDDLWKNENWTQNEVAKYFKVVPSTIKNWRDRGLLRYWQAPGTAKVLFDRDDIRDFCYLRLMVNPPFTGK
jgi:hypothetical protein